MSEMCKCGHDWDDHIRGGECLECAGDCPEFGEEYYPTRGDYQRYDTLEEKEMDSFDE